MPSAGEWSRGAIKTHMGSASQRLLAIRDSLLASLKGSDPAALASGMSSLTAWLESERDWLQSLGDVPVTLRRHPRARLLADYGSALVRVATNVEEAVRARPLSAERFEPVGLGMLQLLAFARSARDL